MFSRKQLALPLAALLLFTASCDDNFLQTEPKGSVSERTFWDTEEDARLAVNNLYSYLYGPERGAASIFVRDAISDIATARNPAVGSYTQYIRGVQNADTDYVTAKWNRSYRGIRAVNEFLANVKEVQADSPQLINRYEAEARFMRAYLYTYLTFGFGSVPLITKPVSIEEAENVTRTDQETVYDFIASELQAAAEVLPVSHGESDQGRITKGAALAMKARAMLYAGRFAEAHEAAKAVMDLEAYRLYPSYEDLFNYGGENNQEVILNKAYIRNDHPNIVFWLLAPNSQHSSATLYVPTKKIVDAYEMKNGLPIGDPNSGYDPRDPYQNRDPRLDYSIFVHGDTLPNGQIYDPRPGFGGADDMTEGFSRSPTGFNIEKYVNPEDLDQPRNCGIDITLIRYAEVLLTYAEAKIETGSIDPLVYEAINQVRQRSDVDMPPIESPKTQEELRRIVRHERMVELAFEGQRFFDIRRWRIAEEVMNGPFYGMTYESEGGELKTVRVQTIQPHFVERDYLLPIPQKEVELIGLTQNPGY